MAKLKKIGHFISRRIGKAIGDYNLIENNDKILIGVSGGKDSLTLLHLLKERQKWAPVKFDLFAAHVRSDFSRTSKAQIKGLENIFKSLDIPYVFKDIKVINDYRQASCFWCSWNRRKALFEAANSLGCKKVALGHHKDDIIETTLLNLFFQGEFSSMNPRQELFQGQMTIIRPLCYVEEKVTRLYAKERGFSNQVCKCRFADDSKRHYVKNLIKDLEKRCPSIKTNLFKSISRIKHDYLKIKAGERVIRGKGARVKGQEIIPGFKNPYNPF